MAELVGTKAGSQPGVQLIYRMADACARWLATNDWNLPCMLEVERRLNIPRTHATRLIHWFGEVKMFERTMRLAETNDGGVLVQVDGKVDFTLALAYGNHSSVDQHPDLALNKIKENVGLGRAFVFLRGCAKLIRGRRLSLLGIVVPPTKTRIIHDLAFTHRKNGSNVNADTNFQPAPPCDIGNVSRSVVWRVLFLRREYGISARTMLSKMDVEGVFRQVTVDSQR